jgi:hypothetical protein
LIGRDGEAVPAALLVAAAAARVVKVWFAVQERWVDRAPSEVVVAEAETGQVDQAEPGLDSPEWE